MAKLARVLIIDDDPIMRELATAKLAEAGYQTVSASHGAEGLSRLQGVDLVISDIDMPGMSGFDVVKSIRDDKETAEIPVIVITGSERPDAVEQAFAAGATSFLAKPINWTLFTQAVRFVLKASTNQRELRSARDAAEAGSRFKDSLLSVMSHELRTPLNAIIGFGQILAEQFDRENDHLHKEYADYIIDGGKRLLSSVSDMLLASDARSGPIALNDVDSSLDDLIDSALAPLEKGLAASQITVKRAIKDGSIEICCDRTLVMRSIGKLIENAAKFSPPGVTITLGAAITKTGGLAILVRDNGPGIEPEKLEAVKMPFGQSDMSLRRSKEGLGLGLPLVNAVMKAHGGELRLVSAPGEGTSAFIVLPASRVHSLAAKASITAS
ncbi:MAG: hybrid sensor histidine kinase/response regulator [Pseudomonadota bacterium]